MNVVKVNSFKNLTKDKNSAIFLGCGPSINHLDNEDVKAINEKLDVWTSNNFLINDEIIPNFYHMEIKHHRNGPLVDRLAKKRAKKYKNTKWIIDQTRSYILNYVKLEDYPSENFYIYPKFYRKESHGKYHPQDDYLSVSVNASLSVISDLMTRMDYDTIYFLGVDMIDSTYFWTKNKKYDDVKIEDIMVTCKAESKAPTEPHPTSHLFNYIPEYFKFNKQKVVNLSTISLLKDTMETKSIKEVISEL